MPKKRSEKALRKSVKQSPAIGNPLLAEDSFDGETIPPYVVESASRSRALGTFESEDAAQLASAIETTMMKAKQLPEMEMRALFDSVDKGSRGTIDKEEVGGPACMTLACECFY